MCVGEVVLILLADHLAALAFDAAAFAAPLYWSSGEDPKYDDSRQ